MTTFIVKTEKTTKVIVQGTNEFQHWSKLEKEYPDSKITLSDKTEDGYLEFKIIKSNKYEVETKDLKEAQSKAPKGEKIKEILVKA